MKSDSWTHIPDDVELPTRGDIIIGLQRFLDAAIALSDREGRLGVRIEPDADIAALLPQLDKLALIAIHFPKFADGRGYSKARLLRQRHGFEGELRAVGDVLADQLFYMQRCGMDAFELKEGKDPARALACLDDLKMTYQGAADDPRPLYRRR